MRTPLSLPKKRTILILATIGMVATVPASIASTMSPPGVAGHSLPIAETVNTARTFRHSLNIHYGEPIVDVEQEAVRSFTAGTLRHLPVFTRPGGEVIVPLSEVLPVLQTAPGNFSVVILGKGVQPASLVGAPSAEWVVKETAAGHHPVLEIMPRFAGLKSSIQIVATSPHGYPLAYTVGLVSDTARFTPVLSFYRIHHVVVQRDTSVSRVVAATGRFNPSVTPIATSVGAKPYVNATHADLDWTTQCFTGDCKSIQPINVISNNKEKITYIHLPTGKTPMVLVRNKNGQSLMVSYRMEGHTLAVNALPYRIDLLTGRWNHLAEMRLTNKAGD